MPFACWITKATNTRSKYVALTAFPWQFLRERVCVNFIRTLSLVFLAYTMLDHFCIHHLLSRPSTVLSTGKLNGVKWPVFWLELASASAYVVKSIDVTNFCFSLHKNLHQRNLSDSVNYTSWRQPDPHRAVLDQSSDHTTSHRTNVCVLRTQINMASKH